MYIQNDLVDAIAVEREKIVTPGYLSSLIRELKEKHKSMIGLYSEPEFLVHDISCNHDSSS